VFSCKRITHKSVQSPSWSSQSHNVQQQQQVAMNKQFRAHSSQFSSRNRLRKRSSLLSRSRRPSEIVETKSTCKVKKEWQVHRKLRLSFTSSKNMKSNFLISLGNISKLMVQAAQYQSSQEPKNTLLARTGVIGQCFQNGLPQSVQWKNSDPKPTV
jgi:hypothetical protein